VPSKLAGVVAMLSSILILGILPLFASPKIKSLAFYGPVKLCFWCHVSVFILLSLGGAWPIASPYIVVSRSLACQYFLFYLLLGLYRRAWEVLIT